jgi:hypothetical protein
MLCFPVLQSGFDFEQVIFFSATVQPLCLAVLLLSSLFDKLRQFQARRLIISMASRRLTALRTSISAGENICKVRRPFFSGLQSSSVAWLVSRGVLAFASGGRPFIPSSDVDHMGEQNF